MPLAGWILCDLNVVVGIFSNAAYDDDLETTNYVLHQDETWLTTIVWRVWYATTITVTSLSFTILSRTLYLSVIS